MSLTAFLQQSRATASFKSAVAEFLRTGRSNEAIRFETQSPPIKVERTLTKLLESYPDLPIERVEIRGSSGCEFFRGDLMLHAAGGVRRVRFHWDCKWRALREGWTDYFGFPDQSRAAREYGYDCFRLWQEEPSAEGAPA